MSVTTYRNRTLDWRSRHDERSLDHPIVATISKAEPRSWQWRPGQNTDQGEEGACGGHGWTQSLMARPRRVVVPSADSYAFTLYKEMQRNDQWPGEDYDGTSVIAGAQVLKARGALESYRWAFGLADLLLALSWKGPAVLGIPWYDSMYEAPDGIVTVSGTKVGGHCLLAYGLHLPSRSILLRNSWGPDWGVNGNARISFEALQALLKDNGEACVPLKSAAYRLAA